MEAISDASLEVFQVTEVLAPYRFRRLDLDANDPAVGGCEYGVDLFAIARAVEESGQAASNRRRTSRC